MPVFLSCGCWYLEKDEITALDGYSGDPITTSVTCKRCNRLRLQNIERRLKKDSGGQLDIFA